MNMQPFSREVKVSDSGWLYRLAMRWPGQDTVSIAEGTAGSKPEAEAALDSLIDDVIEDLRAIRRPETP